MTTTTPNGGLIVIDRSDAETVIYRVALSAFSYYPDKATEEPGYTIQEDVTWCLEPLGALLLPHRRNLGERIKELITDPTADRRSFIRDITTLAEA